MNVVFAGKVVWQGLPGTGASGVVMSDRVGTNRNAARFYPFGDEITSTTNDRLKFATYTRDSYTGLDYANQRFYANTYGRFNTADPYRASGKLSDPSRSWNRFAYVLGDPINGFDPGGLDCNDPGSGYPCDGVDDTSNEDYTSGGDPSNFDVAPSVADPPTIDDPLPFIYGNCPATLLNPLGDCSFNPGSSGSGNGFQPSGGGPFPGSPFTSQTLISILSSVCQASPTALVVGSITVSTLESIIWGAELGTLVTAGTPIGTIAGADYGLFVKLIWGVTG